MNIAILGAGAMGMLFGGYLSQQNDVWLIDISVDRVEKINADGVCVQKNDQTQVFHPYAAVSAEGLGEMDLVIVFVKSMFTEHALKNNQSLIGKDTFVMTLQNGAGHETKLLKFVDRAHVIIGTTQHNSSVLANGIVNHGGGGKTFIGLLDGNSKKLQPIVDRFISCGFDCAASDEVQKRIWNKLFLNTSASALTAVLQVPLGFILTDPNACRLMERLAGEAVAVANAQGAASFNVSTVLQDIKIVLENARGGYTSIYADIKNGNLTEVDTISGSVLETAKNLEISVPYHEMIVLLIHALENKNKN